MRVAPSAYAVDVPCRMVSEILAIASLLAAVPLPVRMPGDVADAYALRVNPAGLGASDGELRLLYGRDVPDINGSNNGLALFGVLPVFDAFTLAAGFELDVTDSGRTAERTSFGMGFGGSSLSFGVSLEHYAPAEGASTNALGAGLQLRLTSFLSAGFAVHDIAQKEQRRVWDLGLTLRPFVTERLALNARSRTIQGNSPFTENRDLAFRIEGEPVNGLVLGFGMNMIERNEKTEIGFTGGLSLIFDTMTFGTGLEDTTTGLYLTSEIAYRSRSRPSLLPAKRVAVLELEGELRPEASFSILSRSFESSPYGAVPLRIDALRRSENAMGLYVRIASLDIGWAKAEELRSLLLAIRSGGRRVDCELSAGGDLEYFLASACTSIIIAPAMSLEMNGIAANVLFFADALDKLGVRVEAVARGRYKSAPEQFTRAGMSTAQHEALSAYLDRLYNTLVDGVSTGRKIDRAEVERLIARGTMTATEAKAANLVDAVLYPDEIDPHMDRLYGSRVAYANARQIDPPLRQTWASRPRIAVIHVESTISGGESKSLPLAGQSAGAETIIGALELARLDPSIRAVVLRVDSPGGDAFASDLIARAVKLLDEQKPVIASFGDAAASGGYYVAAPARTIFAEPTTLTGSIGVFSLKVSVGELLAKIGIQEEAIERGPLSNGGSIFREMSPEEREVMERQVDAAYAQFLDVVAKGRKKAVEDVRQIAEGRIWSGEEAKRLGLVDELGGLLEAIARARRDAGIGEDERVDIISLPTLREALPLGLLASMGVIEKPFAEPWLRLVPHSVRRSVSAIVGESDAVPAARPLALLPFGLDVD
jgi:protease-4